MPFVEYKPCPPCDPIRVFVPDEADVAAPSDAAPAADMEFEKKSLGQRVAGAAYGVAMSLAHAAGVRHDRASEEETARRRAICEACPNITALTPEGRLTVLSRCAKRAGCKCFMKAKTAIQSESCPAVPPRW